MDSKLRVIRRQEMLNMIGVSSVTQWRMEKAGLFPARLKLNRSSVGWLLSEVEEWLVSRERV